MTVHVGGKQLSQEAFMSDFFENVTGQQDIFSRLSSHIPGFSGYVERSNRRAADKLLRETVARRFDELYRRASNLQTELVNAGRLSYLDELEVAVARIQTHGQGRDRQLRLRWFLRRGQDQ
jgi:hypothetical protein